MGHHETGNAVTIIQADARRIPFGYDTFQTIVTSPPYFGLRRYGESELEIGTESLEDYMSSLAHVGEEMYKVLRHDGIAWVNLGDTASGSGGAGGDWKTGSRGEHLKWKQGKSGIPRGQWCLVPQRAAIMFQEQGWYIRSVITWDKMRDRPESIKHVKRPLVRSETILMMTKVSSGYRFRADALKRIWKAEGLDGTPTDIWPIFPARLPGHTAGFPPLLARLCIMASTEVGEFVLDPFAGTGTTMKVAHDLRRHGYGLDLYPHYSH